MDEQRDSVPAERKEHAYLHRLRVLAALAVVFIHTASKDFTVPATATADWQFLSMYEGLSHWAVPVFVMISGALFLDPERELPLKKLFGKYILRILLALVFWSALYAVAYVGIYLRGSLREIWDYFLQGHVHLWYLPMLIGLYLTVPVLRPVARDRTAARSFVALAAVFAVLVPVLAQIPGTGPLRGQFNRLELYLPLGYTGYFVLGSLLHRFELPKTARRWLYALAALATAAAIAVSGIGSARAGECRIWLYDYFSPCVALQSAAVFVLLRQIGERPLPRLLRLLSGCSFGIYLIHELFIDFLRRFCGLGPLSLPTLVSVPLIAALVFALSAAMTALLRQIPLARRTIV
ncbi:MAG: acyltransferase family protein [Oscillospiraceae bacterium]|nr:acyltransferase family protein [Oscillospiraceae bacterium]